MHTQKQMRAAALRHTIYFFLALPKFQNILLLQKYQLKRVSWWLQESVQQSREVNK